MTLETLNLESAKAPLVIAVTGHRDLRSEDDAKLRAVVTEVLQTLRAEFPSTPFILLSPLAAGADRLVASVALTYGKKEGDKTNTQLIVPLPMPARMYVDDFPDSIKEFKELVDHHPTFELDLLSPEEEVAKRPSDARDRQYEAVGKYIVRQCQILLALWDGMGSSEVGATAAVVEFQKRGLPQDSLQPPEVFPVHHIVTPHDRKPDPPQAFEHHIIYPTAFNRKEDAEKYYRKLFSNFEKFNRYIERSGKRFCRKVMGCRVDLLKNAATFTLSPLEEQDLCRYAVSDAMAIRFHNYVQWANRSLQLLVFLSFLSFVFFAHYVGNPPFALVVSFVLFLLGYGAQAWVRYHGIDSRSQDYRAIAEACRVKFFWRIAGITDEIAENYLGMQRTELDWIRNSLRNWGILPDKVPLTEPDKRLEFIRTRWVDREYEFFKERSGTEDRKLKQRERAMKLFLRAAVALTLFTVLLVIYFHLKEFSWLRCSDCEVWLYWLLIPIDLLLALGALLHHSMHQMALAQHVKQYKRMKIIFQKASDLLGKKPDPVAAKECLRKLGQEALKENGDWVLLHRERPSVLPHP